MNCWQGFKIIVSPDLPKMTLGAGDFVTQEFRAQVDAWMLEFFCTKNLVSDDAPLVSEMMRCMWVTPNLLAKLKASTVAQKDGST